jgi:hypothetical protein
VSAPASHGRKGCAGSLVQPLPRLEEVDRHLWNERADRSVRGEFAERIERVWNFVWWRRVAYFITLFGTVFLASMPLWREVKPCSSWICFISPWIAALEFALPGFAATWTQVFASNPDWCLIGAAVIFFGMAMGWHLDARIPDEMRGLLYRTSLRPPRPEGMTDFARPRERGWVNQTVQWLRLGRAYEPFWDVVRRLVFPGAAFVAATVLLLGGINVTLLSARESLGLVCGKEGLTTSGRPFRTSSVCHLAHGEVVAGATYRIRVAIPSVAPCNEGKVAEDCHPTIWMRRDGWWDCTMPATPNGIVPGHEGMLMPAFIPFRRHVSEPWLKLMARVGTNGSDVYSPD